MTLRFKNNKTQTKKKKTSKGQTGKLASMTCDEYLCQTI